MNLEILKDKAEIHFKNMWHLEEYDEPQNEAVIMSEMPDMEKYLKNKEKTRRNREETSAEMAFLYFEPFLTKEQERHLFRKYNFLKYKCKEALERKDCEKAEYCYNEFIKIKHHLTYAYCRLVMNLVNKMKCNDMFRSLSDGCYGLIHAIDVFDFRRGIKFITYAYYAIFDKINKGNKDERKHAVLTNCFIMTEDNELGGMDVICDKVDAIKIRDDKDIIQKSLKSATKREIEIISLYYGLNDTRNLTLDEISKKFRISRERVRQIRDVCLEKIKKFCLENGVEA